VKIVKITVNFDDGSSAEYANGKGVALSDIPGMLGMTPGDMVSAEPGTPQAIILGLIQGVLGIAMKRFGL